MTTDVVSAPTRPDDTAPGVVYCPSTQQVFFDEALAPTLYDRFGDFAVGYLLGGAWSEAAQQALGSPLAGEERVLANDCLTGAWVADLIPDDGGPDERGAVHRARRPRRGDPDGAGPRRRASGDDVVGSGFEKIAGFRDGVLGGFDACTATHRRLSDDRASARPRSTSAPTASTSSSPGRSATTASRR